MDLHQQLMDKHSEYKEVITQAMIDKLGGYLKVGDEFYLSPEYYNWHLPFEKMRGLIQSIGTPIKVTAIDLKHNMVEFNTIPLSGEKGSVTIVCVPLAMVYRMTKFQG